MNNIFALLITLKLDIFLFDSVSPNCQIMGHCFSGYKSPKDNINLKDVSTGLDNAVVPDRLSDALLREKPRKWKRLDAGHDKMYSSVRLNSHAST